jgi:hypothetical protein
MLEERKAELHDVRKTQTKTKEAPRTNGTLNEFPVAMGR